jgi:hypothetical protein
MCLKAPPIITINNKKHSSGGQFCSLPYQRVTRPTTRCPPQTGTIARGAAETGAVEAYMCARLMRHPQVCVL